MNASKDPRFVVHCGDASLHFAYGKLYRQTYLNKVFKKTLDPFVGKFFPGLVFRDGAGNLVKPELRVVLVPVTKPEEA